MLEVLMLLDVLLAIRGDDNVTTIVTTPEALHLISPFNPLVPALCVTGGDLCENEANNMDCADIFSPPNTKVFPPVVDPRCVVPSSFARMCAKTCLLCCQIPPYNCEDKKDPPVPCMEMKMGGLCDVEDGGLKDQIQFWCPQTCGMCPIPETKCEDRNALQCRTLQRSCHDPEYKEFLRYYCPKTCNSSCDEMLGTSLPYGSTSAVDCVDTADYCGRYRHLCNVKEYQSLVADPCMRTCRKCPSSNIACYDREEGCGIWVANGFCTSDYYSVDEKRALCPGSCGLC